MKNVDPVLPVSCLESGTFKVPDSIVKMRRDSDDPDTHVRPNGVRFAFGPLHCFADTPHFGCLCDESHAWLILVEMHLIERLHRPSLFVILSELCA